MTGKTDVWMQDPVTNMELTYGEKQFQLYVNQVIVPRTSSTFANLWGGDLYVLPGRIPTAVPGWSYSNHLEADRCASTMNNWTLRKKESGDLVKVDYAFRSGRARGCAGDASLYPGSSSSMFPVGSYTADHRIEMARWS